MLDPGQLLPAPGQGALALECRVADADLVEPPSPRSTTPTPGPPSPPNACCSPTSRPAAPLPSERWPTSLRATTAPTRSTCVVSSPTWPAATPSACPPPAPAATPRGSVTVWPATCIAAGAADLIGSSPVSSTPKKPAGTVTFVGGGPGDPGLLTLNAVAALQRRRRRRAAQRTGWRRCSPRPARTSRSSTPTATSRRSPPRLVVAAAAERQERGAAVRRRPDAAVRLRRGGRRLRQGEAGVRAGAGRQRGAGRAGLRRVSRSPTRSHAASTSSTSGDEAPEPDWAALGVEPRAHSCCSTVAGSLGKAAAVARRARPARRHRRSRSPPTARRPRSRRWSRPSTPSSATPPA